MFSALSFSDTSELLSSWVIFILEPLLRGRCGEGGGRGGRAFNKGLKMSYKKESERLSSSNWRYRQRENHSELQTPAEKMEMKMSCVCLVLGLVLLMTVSSDADSEFKHFNTFSSFTVRSRYRLTHYSQGCKILEYDV